MTYVPSSVYLHFEKSIRIKLLVSGILDHPVRGKGADWDDSATARGMNCRICMKDVSVKKWHEIDSFRKSKGLGID